MMVSKHSDFLLALHSVNGLGPVRLKKLLDYFEDPQKAWLARKTDWQKMAIPINVIDQWLDARQNLDLKKYTNHISEQGIKYTTIYNEDYPALLKQIYDPPIVLYYKGDLGSVNKKAVAVVGSRKMSGYGKLVTEKFTSVLASCGLTITSGLARGVDTQAHRSALGVKGLTVAILGGGLFSIFPPENDRLAQEIIDCGGALVSEFPPSWPSLPGNFPARNRIISGLSMAVLVTEAAEDSGSIITAKEALDQGREVFAVPGPITSTTSLGTALLIKQGATLVSDPAEILDHLGMSQLKVDEFELGQLKLDTLEQKVLASLTETRHVDEICRELQLAAPQVSATLIKLEIKGLVRNLGGGNYSRL